MLLWLLWLLLCVIGVVSCLWLVLGLVSCVLCVGGRGVCLVCVFVCVFVCVLRLAEKNVEKPVFGFKKTSPCVHSKRHRVCRHHAHMLKHPGRFERTHGDVFEWTHEEHGVIVSSAHLNLPT